MNTPKYERPKFEFQELQLLERVADTCWGYKEAWYDFNGNGTKDPSEIIPIWVFQEVAIIIFVAPIPEVLPYTPL